MTVPRVCVEIHLHIPPDPPREPSLVTVVDDHGWVLAQEFPDGFVTHRVDPRLLVEIPSDQTPDEFLADRLDFHHRRGKYPPDMVWP